MRRLVMAAAALALVAVACASRPSGVVEKWLDGVDEGRPERAAEWADGALYDRVLEGATPKETNERLTRVEVGAAREEGAVAFVTFRLRLNVKDEDSGDAAKKWDRRYTARLERTGDDWKVVDLLPPDPADKLPSEGGKLPARAPGVAFVGAAGIGCVVAVMVALPAVVFDRRKRRVTARAS